MNRSQFFFQCWYQQQWQAFKSDQDLVRVGCVGVVRFAEIHLQREGKDGKNAQEREKTETGNQETEAAHTVGACPSCRALRLLPKPKGIVCVHAHPH